VSNSFICLTSGVPKIVDTLDYSKRFITNLASIYPLIEKLDSKYVNWPEIVEKGINDLFEYEKVTGRAQVSGKTNLNSCKRYAQKFESERGNRLVKNADEIISRIKPRLPYRDAWQFLWQIIMVGEYAEQFKAENAKKQFLNTADAVTDLGRRLSYIFPLRINADYEKAGKTVRYEYDCTGAYVYLMLLYYKLSGQDKYLGEAKAAADRLLKMGFEFPYEFTTTALVPVALLRVYKLTGQKEYLEGSYIPLAANLRHSLFFNPDYGDYKDRTIFMLTEAMPGVYANGWEEASMIRYLYLYLAEGYEILMPEAVQLTSELLRYKGTSLADSLAPLLPDKSIIYKGIPREGDKLFPPNKDWHIPLEGFGYLEYDKSGLHDKPGRVNQATYCFGALPEAALLQFHPLLDEVFLYVESPIILEREHDNTFTFEVLAKRGIFTAGVGGKIGDVSEFTVRQLKADMEVELKYNSDSGLFRFDAAAEEKYMIEFENYKVIETEVKKDKQNKI